MPAHRKPLKTCERCKREYRPKCHYNKARYCGRPCAVLARSRAQRQAAGRKGGKAKAEKGTGGAVRRQARIVIAEGLTPLEAFAAGARWQRRREQARGYRAGFWAGYERGLKDSEV